VTGLTPRQQQVLDWVREYIALNQFPPTRAEIAEAFGFGSVNAADQHLRALEKRGAISLVPGISRGIVVPPPTSQEKRSRNGTG
jgi:repressor LexA